MKYVIILCTSLTVAALATAQTMDDKVGLENEARRFMAVLLDEDAMEIVYDQAVHACAAGFETLGREFTGAEKQALSAFLRRQIKLLIPKTDMVNLVAPAFAQCFTLDDLEELNRYFETPLGKKVLWVSPRMIREASAAGNAVAQQRLANGERLTPADFEEVNRFYSTPLGQKLLRVAPTMTREVKAVADTLCDQRMNSAWVERLGAELKAQFPQWFPNG